MINIWVACKRKLETGVMITEWFNLKLKKSIKRETTLSSNSEFCKLNVIAVRETQKKLTIISVRK
jgi:hypothetical protein